MIDDLAGQDNVLSQVNGQIPKATLTHLDRGRGSKYRGYWRVTPLDTSLSDIIEACAIITTL